MRVSKSSNAIIEKPEPIQYLKYCKTVKKGGPGPKDTPPHALLKNTLEESSLNDLD